MCVVSIIVPVYNIQEFLKECIESLRCQTLQDIEIILVDDGSTDNSATICDYYARIDGRIKVTHQKNAGPSAARNVGMKMATGEYLAFVDADDYVASNMYEVMLGALQREKADVVLCNCSRVDEQDRLLEEYRYCCDLHDMVCTGTDIINMTGVEKQWQWLTVIAWNRLCRRESYEHLEWDEGKKHEDEFLFFPFFECMGKVVCLSEPLYFYRKRRGSITEEVNVQLCLDQVDAMNQRIIDCMEKGYLGGIEYYERILYTDYKTVCWMQTNKEVKTLAAIRSKRYMKAIKMAHKLRCIPNKTYLKRRCFLLYFMIKWKFEQVG